MPRQRSSAPPGATEPAEIDLGREFQIMASDKLRTGHLDRNSKSLLFLLATTAFNEWEKEFLNDYRTLIEHRIAHGIGRGTCNADSTAFYTLMKAAVNRKCEVLNPDSKPDFSSGNANHYINFSTQPRPSFLRRAVQVYRMDVFLKVLLIIFLLKLPSFCYILSIICYILYCCGALTLWLRIYRYARESPAVGEFIQANQALATRLQGYMQQLMNPIQPTQFVSSIQPQNSDVTAESSQQEGASGNADGVASSSGTSSADDHNFNGTTTTGASDEKARQESPSINGDNKDKLVDDGAAKEDASDATGQQELNFNADAKTGSTIHELKSLKQQQTDETQAQTQALVEVQIQSEDTQANVTRPVPLHNAVYQVIVAFALSMLPWCDTSNF